MHFIARVLVNPQYSVCHAFSTALISVPFDLSLTNSHLEEAGHVGEFSKHVCVE